MLLLLGASFAAGFVDAIVGGGGLIQLPALFVFLPPSLAGNVAAVMGTNKFASICGTAVATAQYAARVPLPWRAVLPTAAAAAVFSFLGARAVSLMNPALIKPLILALLVAVAIYTYTRKKPVPQAIPPVPRGLWVGALMGAAIGFYDGFFGPGTGTFLIIALVGLFGLDFLHASASAKFVNLATNLAAIAWFAAAGNIYYEYGLPMAAANIAGSFAGSRMAILKGSEFVRKFFLGVVLVLIARFGYEMLLGK